MPAVVASIRDLVLVGLSVVAFALSFPPWGIHPLAWVCLVPLFWVIRRGRPLRGVLFALVWGQGMPWAIASVFPSSIAAYYERAPWVGFVLGNLIFLTMAAAYYGVFAALDRLLPRKTGPLSPLLVAATWVSVELARGRLFTGTPFFIGNPWGLIGYTHASGPLAQIASVTGVYGISFAIVSVNAALAQWISLGRGRSTRRGIGVLAVGAAPALFSFLFGLRVLEQADVAAGAENGRPVAVVQGNVSIERRWRSDFHAKNLEVYLGLTQKALTEIGSGATPATVVWPENAMNFFLESEPSLRTSIERVLGKSGAVLIAGGPSGEGDRLPPYFNSVFAVEAGRGVTARYDKELLVPFSEYFPAASLDFMRRRLDGARTFAHGPPDPAPIPSPLGPAGVLICNEAMLPEVAAARVRAGAQVLISPSNDGWIVGRAFAEHMLAVVALRAVEQGRYLIRASTSGPSAIVDPRGRIVTRTSPFDRAVLTGRVRPIRSPTSYGRVGDTFGVVCLVATGFACTLGRLGSRRDTG